MILNRQNIKNAFVGFNAIFNEAFEQAEPLWPQVAMEVPSEASEETYGWLGQSAQFRRWLGDRVVQNLKAHDYTVRNESYENTIGVDRDDMEDDRYGVYRPLLAQMGRSAAEHPDHLVFSLLKSGFSERCYDGQYFFDTDHPVGSTTVANTDAVAGTGEPWYLLDARQAIKPLIFQKRRDYQPVWMDEETDEAVFSKRQLRYGVDARVAAGFGLWQMAWGSKQALDAANFAAARTAMQSFVNDAGEPLGVVPNLLVVPPALEEAGCELLKAERLANGATNVWKDRAELLVVPWLV